MSGKSTLVSLPMEARQWGESRAWPTAHLAPVLDSNSDPVLLQPELPSDDLLGCGLRPLQGVFLQAVSHVSLPACLSAFLSLLQDHLHFAEAHFQQRLQLPHCWRGSVAGPPSGRWSSGSAPFPTEPPRQTPRGPAGTPGSFLFHLSLLASCPISFSVARGLLAVPASGRTAGDHVRPGRAPAPPGGLGKQAPTSPAPTWGP